MKKSILFTLLIGTCFFLSKAQDAYHSSLLSFLQTDYNLPAGSWLFYDTEAAINSNKVTFGNTTTTETVTDEPFSIKSKINLSQAPANVFSSQWYIQNKQAVQQGDVIWATFYIRSVGQKGKVSFFIENAVTYSKEMYLTMSVDTVWRRFMIPVQTTAAYPVNGLTFGLHLGYQAQNIEFGGFTGINYAKTVALSALPNQINNQFYDGWEPDAPWRAEAATRIEQLRKTDLTIVANNTLGAPVENASFRVKMLKHDFPFGSAITANKIAGNNAQNNIYQNKILNLDGKGNGFNSVVFENDMKWPAWESGWFVTKSELVNAVSWLHDQDLTIRGHTLLWPGFTNMPNDITTNAGDINYVRNRVLNHIESITNYPGMKGQIDEWDVLNETVTNDDIEAIFQGKPGYPTGREFFVEVFDKLREEDSTVGMWINDFVTMSLAQEAGNPQYDRLKANIQELVAAGVDLEGIGFQGHLGGSPNGIPSVLGTLDDFYNAFGLKSKITEFDLPSYVDEEVAATYLTDFMTAIFGHPSSDGFYFWNFWDGSSWLNEGTNLFRLDWSMTPSGEAYIDLVFNQWWTDDTLTTDASGQGSIRGFKGDYEVSYLCNGVWVRDTLSITSATTINIVCDNINTSISQGTMREFEVNPNPTDGFVTLRQPDAREAKVALLDVNGRMVFQQMITGEEITLRLDHIPAGLYLLRIQSELGVQTEKLMVR